MGFHYHVGNAEKALMGFHYHVGNAEKVLTGFHCHVDNAEKALMGSHYHVGNAEKALRGFHYNASIAEKALMWFHYHVGNVENVLMGIHYHVGNAWVTLCSTWAKQGAFELTHGSSCSIGWNSGMLDIFIPPYIAQLMRCVIGGIHYGLKVVFCFKHFTASHYHHDARLLTCIEHM